MKIESLIKGYGYSVFTDIEKGAQIIVSNRLFVNAWTMRDLCKSVLEDRKSGVISHIIFAYSDEDDSKPIASLIVDTTSNYYAGLNTFVRKAHRRKGVGGALVRVAKDILGVHVDFRSFEGIKGSNEFYESCGIVCY